MTDSFIPLMKAVVAALEADATLTTLVADRIYSNLPTEAQEVFPYVYISIDSADFSAKDFTGMEHTVQVQGFSRKASTTEAAEIRSAVYNVLNRSEDTLTLDTGRVVSVDYTGTSTIFKEQDGNTWQSLIQFKTVVT